MNFMSYVNELTQTNYGFPSLDATSSQMSADQNLVVIRTENAYLPEDPNAIATKFVELMEKYQQVAHRGNFYEAKAVQVNGVLSGPRTHTIHILGQAALCSATDESDEALFDDMTQGYQTMSVQEMVADS